MSINSGGEKIYPEEVEAALKGHPDVFDALVVGVPDERFGQHVAAVVQPRDGTSPTLAELDAFVRSEIAGYKVPRSLWLVDEIQRIAGGQARLPLGQGHRPRSVLPTTSTPNTPGAQHLMRTELCDRFGIDLPDLRLHPVGEGRRRGQQGRRARACSAASGSTTPTSSRAC